VADVIQPAPSGRAKCRGCGRAIAKGELRFGESFANPYAEGEALSWFHVPCAALMRPEKLLPTLDVTTGTLAERDWLARTAAVGVAHRRLPRLCGVERASSGRAECRQCREPIAKGTFRFRLQMFEEGRANPIGTIHVGCAEAYFGTRELLERLSRLAPELSSHDTVEVTALLASQKSPLAPLAKTDAEPEIAPGSRKSG
jgi:Poly(ADP-ribose) polymerase and DNA-Ligase Zn-finger region